MQTVRKRGKDGALAPLLLYSTPTAVAFFFFLLLPSIVSAGGRSQWQVLSAQNFSSQIHLHPYALVFVTVPWCGESRSIMKEVSDQLTGKQDKLGSIELMVVFRNRERVLAESLGATEGMIVLFYRHAVPYKYRGRLSARDILSSADYLVSLKSDVLPLIMLSSSDDLRKFLASTDKAVLLLDSCRWAPGLLTRHNINETSKLISTNGGGSAKGFNVETKQTVISGGQKDLEATKSGKMKCGIDTGFGGIPWVGGFNSYNEGFSSMETHMQLSAGPSCGLEDYQKFASFFSKFIAIARDMFLPLQQQRYGLLSNMSLLSSIGVEVFDRWSLIVYYAGCPNCSRVLKDESYLQSALGPHDYPVVELVDAGMDTGPSLPGHELSVVLFVDRLSHSVEIRRRSEAALSAFREAVLHYKYQYQMNAHTTDQPKRPLVQTYKSYAQMSESSTTASSSLTRKIKPKDKISVVIINEGKHATLDNTGLAAEGHSLHEVLTYLLRQKKQATLSSLAKEAGFQLLSDDIDINMTDDSVSHTESLSDSDSTGSSSEHVMERGGYTGKKLNLQSPSLEDHDEQLSLPDKELSNSVHEKATQGFIGTHSSDADSEQLIIDDEFSVPYTKEKSYQHVDQVLKELHQSQGFASSFFFSDGNCQLLRSLTGELKVPRMLIIDPISQTHYVSLQKKDFSHLSISSFINEVFDRRLSPHQRSASLERHIVAPRPPFVNLDFREKDSIPSLTTNIFTELVIGSSSLAAQNASTPWNKDVLVLFSNSWCGFCQRMDLIVREVHRSLKGYMGMVRGRSKSKKVVISNDSWNAVMSELPVIYRIDCTWNDCSWIFKSVDQRELYPALLLFPAKRKFAIPYEGDMAVNDIINFIADHGSSFHLVPKKGKKNEFQNLAKDAPSTVNYHESSSYAKDDTHEMISIDAGSPKYNLVTGSFLSATDKLAGANSFSGSRILILVADQNVGFQGLIVNKPIGQKSLAELGVPEQLKEAAVYFGGPVMHPKLPLVALTKKPLKGVRPEVFPGIYFLDQVAASDEIENLKAGHGSAAEFWFFLGYSSWSWDQLFEEISMGAWAVDESNDKHLEWP